MPDPVAKTVASKAVQWEVSRYEALPLALRVVFLVLSMSGVALAIFYVFGFTIGGRAMLDFAYYYLLFALFTPCVFLIMPGHRSAKRHLPWYDALLAVLGFAIPFYYFFRAQEILLIGWTPPPNTAIFLSALVYVAICMEAARRLAGYPYVIVIGVIGIYPMVAEYMPGALWGRGFTFPDAIASFVFSPSGMVGLPGQIMGNIMIAYLVFSGVMVASGAGDFFLSLATALLGKFRGGPAKVSVFGSALFGSLSGSVFANVVGTGSFTIPAMKKLGFAPHYAGAVEAVASTGGILMPPVMGAVAFMMAIILNVEYREICIAAAIPAMLYYYGLIVQVDAYAARIGMRGLPAGDVPKARLILKEGWPFLAVLAFLLWGLMYMRLETMAPFYAAVLMILLSFVNRKTFLTPKRFVNLMVGVGRLITVAMSVVLPIGIVVAGLTLTGATLSSTAFLVSLGKQSIMAVLLIGAVVIYILGMVGVGGYLFLAITLAPSVIALGLNPLAVHLFLLYYSMLSAFTPPVAVGAFLAAALAGAAPMRTAWTAMRLGIVIYFIPFFFVFNPALVLQGNLLDTAYLLIFSLVGILLLGAGMEGYLLKIGALSPWARAVIAIAGALIAFPNWESSIPGAILAVVGITVILLQRRWAARKAVAPSGVVRE